MTSIQRIRGLLACGLLLLSASHSRAADDWRTLLTLLPESTNAVLAIDVDSLLATPLAQTNHWGDAPSPQFPDQLTLLPPNAKRFVLATELGLEHFEPLWEFVAMKLDHATDVEQLQADIGGHIDSVAGLRGVRTDRDSYIIPFKDDRLGLIRIAPRAWVAQQARHAQTRLSPTLAPFLATAVTRATDQSQIVIAINLEDALPLETIRSAIARSTLLANSEFGLDALAETFLSLEGFVFTVQTDEVMHGKLEMVFHDPPVALAKFGKPLMLDLLSSAGSSLPEFSQWQSDQVGNSLTLEGELSIEGLRKLMSLLHYDVSDMTRPSSELPSRPTGPTARATAAYAKHVTRFVNALKDAANTNSLNTQVLWTDRAAKSIMRLSTKNVRPEVADLGTQIAYELSNIVSVFNNAEHNAAIQSNAQALPAIQWHPRLVPYEFYKTPGGIFYRYAPINMATVNIGENLQRSAAIERTELTKANERASDKFYQLERKVDELVRQSELP